MGGALGAARDDGPGRRADAGTRPARGAGSRGWLAGLARASTLPTEEVQALRELTRARRDLFQARTAPRQRLHDELVRRVPGFARLLAQLPGDTDLGSPSVLQILCASS